MTKLLKRYGLWGLALTMVMVGCEGAQNGALVGPGEKDEVLLTWHTQDGYTIARETDPTVGVVTAVIDQNGGVLSIGKHLLWVPAGAVTAPTTFVMNKLPGEIKVDLTATQLLPNDVGAAGFLKPVRLTLNYGDAVNVTDPSKLGISWMRSDGTLVRQDSYLDTQEQAVKANLNHFSAYVIQIDE